MDPSPRYTAAELARIRAEFGKRASFSQKFVPMAVGLIVLLIAIGFVGIYLVPTNYKILASLLVVGVGVVLVFGVAKIVPGLRCPGCDKDIEKAWGQYCPECGGHGLRVVEPHFRAVCSKCNRELKYAGGRGTGNARRRLYKIRACTNCGVVYGRTSI